MRGNSPFETNESAWIGFHAAKLKDFRRDERAWIKAFDEFADKYPAPTYKINLTQFRAHARYLRRKKQAKIKAATGKKNPVVSSSTYRTKPSANRSQNLAKKSCLEFDSAASVSAKEARDSMAMTTKQLSTAVGRLGGAEERIKHNELEIQSLKSHVFVNEQENEDRFRQLEEQVDKLLRREPKKRLVRSRSKSFHSFDAFADEESDE